MDSGGQHPAGVGGLCLLAGAVWGQRGASGGGGDVEYGGKRPRDNATMWSLWVAGLVEVGHRLVMVARWTARTVGSACWWWRTPRC